MCYIQGDYIRKEICVSAWRGAYIWGAYIVRGIVNKGIDN